MYEGIMITTMLMIWMENVGLRLKREKCEFLLPSLKYLGYKISAMGPATTK